jgi:hypothetical protein
MINKLKYVGVLSISLVALGNGAFAQSSVELNPNQRALLNRPILEKPIAKLPPVEIPSDRYKPIGVLPPVQDNKLKPIVSNFPTPALDDRLKPVVSNFPTPIKEVPTRLPPIVGEQQPLEPTPIYGSYDPETGGVIVSHTPPTTLPVEGPTVYNADGHHGTVKEPIVSNFPTPASDDESEVNPTNTVNIKNLNPNQIAVMKEAAAREKAAGNLNYKAKGQVSDTVSGPVSTWSTE